MTFDSSLIYLDNNATTRVDPAVVAEMLPYLSEQYGNPSSVYSLGKAAAGALQKARSQVAGLLGCDPHEIVFTSCGTEATNAAIQSALTVDPDRQHVVTTRVEHSATLKMCEHLAKRGVEVTWLGVDARGQIDLRELEKAVRSDTALVSVMWANNETGTVFPIAEIQEITRKKGVYFHTDAVQAVGKIELNLRSSGVQFLSMSGHKLHCPKGIGALYVNKKTRFTPFMHGGSQENGKRGGTENLASIVALGKACEIAGEKMEEEQKAVRALRDQFEQGVLARIAGVKINGDPDNRLPNTSNLAFEGVDGETLLLLLDQRRLCCSAGSACTSGSVHASHVLKAMGHSDSHARSSLRFSFSRFNSLEETVRALDLLEATVAKIRSQ